MPRPDAWTAEHAATLEPQIDAATRTDSRVRNIAIDAARIDRLDTFGAWLLERAMRTWTSQGCETRLVGLRDDYRGLFDKVHTGTHKLTPEPPKPNSIIATLGERRPHHGGGRRRPYRCSRRWSGR